MLFKITSEGIASVAPLDETLRYTVKSWYVTIFSYVYIYALITHTSRFCQAIEIQYFASSFMFLALRAVNISWYLTFAAFAIDFACNLAEKIFWYFSGLWFCYWHCAQIQRQHCYVTIRNAHLLCATQYLRRSARLKWGYTLWLLLRHNRLRDWRTIFST